MEDKRYEAWHMEPQLSTEPSGQGRAPGEVAEIVLACPQTVGAAPEITGLYKLPATSHQHELSKGSKSDFHRLRAAFVASHVLVCKPDG